MRGSLAVLFVLSLLLPVAAGQGEYATPDEPVAATRFQVYEGYNWSESPEGTHVVYLATVPQQATPLDSITTLYIHAEWFGLVNEHDYELRWSAQNTTLFARGTTLGSGVFWHLPAIASTWELVDVSAPLIVISTLTLLPRPDSTSTSSAYVSCWTAWRCSGGGGSSGSPGEYQAGWVIRNAAYSMSSHIKIEVENCYSHSLKVDGKASAPGGGTQAGMTYTATSTWCHGFASDGAPVLDHVKMRFKRHTSPDGSWSIAADSLAGEVLIYREPKAGMSMPGPNAQKVCTNTQVGFTYVEDATVAVYYGWGVTVFDTGLGVTIQSAPNQRTEIRITITPGFLPGGQVNKYYLDFVASRDTGVGGLIPGGVFVSTVDRYSC